MLAPIASSAARITSSSVALGRGLVLLQPVTHSEAFRFQTTLSGTITTRICHLGNENGVIAVTRCSLVSLTISIYNRN